MGDGEGDRVLEIEAQGPKVLEAAWESFGSIVGEVSDAGSGNPDTWPS